MVEIALTYMDVGNGGVVGNNHRPAFLTYMDVSNAGVVWNIRRLPFPPSMAVARSERSSAPPIPQSMIPTGALLASWHGIEIAQPSRKLMMLGLRKANALERAQSLPSNQTQVELRLVQLYATLPACGNGAFGSKRSNICGELTM